MKTYIAASKNEKFLACALWGIWKCGNDESLSGKRPSFHTSG
jgi:hypothetical protein